MTGGTFLQMKLIFVMQNGAFKPQGSPCLKSSISGPPSGETFQTTHPVKKPTKKSKKDSLKLPLQTYSQVLSFCVIFDFPMWPQLQALSDGLLVSRHLHHEPQLPTAAATDTGLTGGGAEPVEAVKSIERMSAGGAATAGPERRAPGVVSSALRPGGGSQRTPPTRSITFSQPRSRSTN